MNMAAIRMLRYLALAGLFAAAPVLAGQAGTLQIGVIPNVSARANAALYQPLQAYLEEALGQRVMIFSAPNYQLFLERTLNHEFDVVVIAPQMARTAQSEGGWLPLFTYAQQLRALFVVKKSSDLHTLEDLRGKSIAIPDRLAVVPLLGVRMLKQHGLRADLDFRLRESGSHNNAALTVLHGDAPAAIIGRAAFAQLPEEIRGELRTIATSEAIPSLFVMAAPGLDMARREAFRKSLAAFGATPEGQRFFESNGFGGLKPATEAELKTMDPYARDLQILLKSPK